MRKYSLIILLTGFFSICSYAQQNQIVLPSSLHLPSKSEISRQFNEWLELKRKRTANLDFDPAPSIVINDSIVKSLTPIVFVRIYPDTLDNNTLRAEVMERYIALWYSGGYSFRWVYDDRFPLFARALNPIGVRSVTDNIKNEINKLLPREYLLAFFSRGDDIWLFNHIGYSENGMLFIRNIQGGGYYDSLEDLIISRYGNVENYVRVWRATVGDPGSISTEKVRKVLRELREE